MQTYENRHIGLQLDFPDAWTVLSWKHGHIDSDERSAYQSSDDEFPRTGESASKFLFTACAFARNSRVVIDADIELSIFRLAAGEDLQKMLLANHQQQGENDPSTSIDSAAPVVGSWSIDSVDFGYVETKSADKNRASRFRFFYCQLDQVYWLYGKIAGHRAGTYDEALQILQGMKCKALRQSI